MSTVLDPFPPAKTALDTSSLTSNTSSLPLWDRISVWASENKAVVYTIAGVAVVISSAGVIYYLSESRKADVEEKRRISKRDKRKNKKEKGSEQEQPAARTVDEQPVEQGMLRLPYSLGSRSSSNLPDQRSKTGRLR